MVTETKYAHHPVRIVKGLSLGEEYNPGQIIKHELVAAAIKTASFSDTPWDSWDIDDMLPSGTTRPQNAIAVILDAEVNDAGSSGTETYLALATPGIIVAGKTAYVRPGGVNDQKQNRTMIVEITADGKFAAKVEASGGSTFDVVLKLVGWVIAGTLKTVVTMPYLDVKGVFQVNHP